MSEKPSFVATPAVGMGQISAANANLDGTGTLVDIVTAGASGTRVESITVKAAGTTTAGMVRLFLNDGSNTRLFMEIAVSAVTPAANTPAFSAEEVFDNGLILPSGWKLKAATEKAETFNVMAFGGNF